MQAIFYTRLNLIYTAAAYSSSPPSIPSKTGGKRIFFTSQGIRSHGCLYIIEDKAEGVYEYSTVPSPIPPSSSDIDYYGWIKSLTLSLAGDIL